MSKLLSDEAYVELLADADRWRTFEKVLRIGIRGTEHGTRIKVVEVCPMYGDEKQVNDVTYLIDSVRRK